MLRRVTYPTTIGLAASILSLGAPAPVQAQSVDCPDGAVVVLDGEQICFPYASGGVPMQGGPLQVQAPRSGGGTQEWCHRHDDRDHDSPTNPMRVRCKLGEDWWFIRDWDCYVRQTDEDPPEGEIPRWDIGPDEEGVLFAVQCYPPQEAPPPPGEDHSTPYLDLEGRWQARSYVLGPDNPPGFRGTPSVIPQLCTLAAAAKALADAVHAGALGALSVERADGEAVHASPLRDALTAAGFRVTPRGLRLRP